MLSGADTDAKNLLATGDALYVQGDYRQAAACYATCVEQNPDDPVYQHRVGLACARLGEHAAAEFSYRRAIELDPNYAAAHAALAALLGGQGKMADAIAHARRSVELAPADPHLALNLALLSEADRDLDTAWSLLDAALAAGHETVLHALLYSRIAGSRKREAGALELIDRLLERRAFTTARDPSALHLAAAHVLDRLGRYDEAFARAKVGHESRGGIGYSPEAAQREVDDWIAFFTPQRLASLPRATHADAAPVFIVGMPRSGTSLVEQILASHPAVHGAGELDWVQRLWLSALQRRPIDRVARGSADLCRCIAQFTTNDCDALAAEYLKPLHALAPAASRVTDKMPQNVMNLGLIALLFPQAKIVHCRRDPMDTCLSCYLTDFGVGHDFARNLTFAGHLYRQYARIMEHWHKVLPVPILEVDYESLVYNLEGQSRRLVSFVGVPWNDRCLDFHNTRRPVLTASLSQVRQPIYRSSVGRWRNYRKHLDPLAKALRS